MKKKVLWVAAVAMIALPVMDVLAGDPDEPLFGQDLRKTYLRADSRIGEPPSPPMPIVPGIPYIPFDPAVGGMSATSSTAAISNVLTTGKASMRAEGANRVRTELQGNGGIRLGGGGATIDAAAISHFEAQQDLRKVIRLLN